MYCIIMAGGSGTRFWPKSREEKPKQFLSIFSRKSLLQSTVARFESILPEENIFIIARESQRDIIQSQLPRLNEKNIILEPIGRDTGPCIGLATMMIHERDPNAVVIVTPADHLIRKKASFFKTVKAAEKLAERREGIITIGIIPDRPATGFGYVQIDGEVETIDDVTFFRVKTFAEKPNLATAQRFIESGDFFWNSGMFVFRSSFLMEAIEKHLPDLHDGLMEIRQALNRDNVSGVISRVYHQLKGISIDYGIMEKEKNVFLAKGKFVWNDLGNWEQVYRLSRKDNKGNVMHGNVVALDTANSFISTSKGVVAVVGLEDVIVVHEAGAILVCRRDCAEEVKNVLSRLKREKLNKYL